MTVNDDHDQSESGGIDEAVEALVSLGRSDRPPVGARQRAFRAIAVGAVLGVPAQSAALAASAAASTATSATSATSATAGSFLVVTKWGAIGALSATALFGAVDGVSALVEPAPEAKLPATQATSIGTSSGAARGPRFELAPVPVPPAEPEREARPVPGKPSPREKAPITPAPATASRAVFEDTPPSQLAAEVRILDAARSALAAGRVAEALAHLDRHAAAFSSGTLEGEAAAIRIDALVKAGATADAQRRAGEFLTAHPNSPLGARVRALVASPNR